jgi:hypothetical protein
MYLLLTHKEIGRLKFRERERKWLKYGEMDMLRRKAKQLSHFKTTREAKKINYLVRMTFLITAMLTVLVVHI